MSCQLFWYYMIPYVFLHYNCTTRFSTQYDLSSHKLVYDIRWFARTWHSSELGSTYMACVKNCFKLAVNRLCFVESLQLWYRFPKNPPNTSWDDGFMKTWCFKGSTAWCFWAVFVSFKALMFVSYKIGFLSFPLYVNFTTWFFFLGGQAHWVRKNASEKILPRPWNGGKTRKFPWTRGHLFGTVSPTAATLNVPSAGEGF